MSKFEFSQFDNSFILRHPDHDLETLVQIEEGETVESLLVHALRDYMKVYGDSIRDKSKSSNDFYDEVWMDGKPYRFDYSQQSKKGQEILINVRNRFPDETIFDDDKPGNILSRYESDRADYPNETFGYYSFVKVPDSIIDRFGLEYSNYDVFGQTDQSFWYALKFDKTTEDVKCKAVISGDEISEEIKNKIADLIPFGYTDTIGTKAFYARIHNEDKSVSSEIDVYFVTIPAVVNSICEDQGLSYPYGEYKQNPNLEENNFIWGAVYDTETEKLKHIKGYARFYN